MQPPLLVRGSWPPPMSLLGGLTQSILNMLAYWSWCQSGFFFFSCLLLRPTKSRILPYLLPRKISVWLQSVLMTVSSLSLIPMVWPFLFHLANVLHVPVKGKLSTQLLSLQRVVTNVCFLQRLRYPPLLPSGLYSGKKPSACSLQHLLLDLVGSCCYLLTLCYSELSVTHGSMNHLLCILL